MRLKWIIYLKSFYTTLYKVFHKTHKVKVASLSSNERFVDSGHKSEFSK